MPVRPNAEIRADFPDDEAEDEEGNYIFSGRGMAEAIAAILQQLGYKVSPPEHQGENGWDFNIKTQGKRVWMQVSDLDDGQFVLQSKYYPGFHVLKRDETPYAKMLVRLNSELLADARFDKVEWKWDWDLLKETRGATNPVAG